MHSSWQDLYHAALAEEDREKLIGLVGALESAIVRRRQELAHIAENDKERAAMVLAAEDLLKIKTEKLGWPALKPNAPHHQSSDVIDKIRRVESIHHWHR